MTAEANINAALAALQSGNPKYAADILRQVASAIPSTEMPWLALANAEMALGRMDAAHDAADRQLALNRRDIAALLMKGLMFEKMQDARAATSYFQAAINQAGISDNVPAELQGLLRHGSVYIAESADAFKEHLEQCVGRDISPRLREAIDLLTGKRQIYLQQPSVFYYPNLPQISFYESDQFAWLQPMLDLLPAMQAEFTAFMTNPGHAFAPYLQSGSNRPASSSPLLDDPAWSACYFYRNGVIVDDHAQRCPSTMRALSFAPMPQISGRAPNALWSRLQPGAHIQPHHGMLNTRLICHIPIQNAPNCSFRVGSHWRVWEDGIPFIFDDSIEHEARNDGNASRVILLFEIWRPEIPEEDRKGLGSIFQAIDTMGSM